MPLFRCPTKGCGYREDAGKAPFWNPCPSCRQPVGRLVLFVEDPAPAPVRASAKKALRKTGA
ncbi:MAG: hypothetical protein QOG31_218 [Thermoplasmata archaeon]|jgi:hypothetical protein|nr:hypothetical protein [Thermoplasmata archaeon]